MAAPTSHLLTFLLPEGAKAHAGRAAESVFGCSFDVGYRLAHVSVYGRSREAVFAQASRILELACAGDGRHTISANLYISKDRGLDEGRDWLLVGSAVDNWTIIVIHGQVAFSPTALGAEFPLQPDLPSSANPRLSVAGARAKA